MILRRLAESVRKQDWLTVVLEILIVVIGIFVGLQADDWNRARLEKVEEAEILARLADDLWSSAVETKSAINWMAGHAEQGTRIMASLDACQLPDDAKSDFATGLYHIGKISPVYLIRGTINEIRSTGKLALISNVELRRQINNTIQEYEDGRDILEDLRGRMASQINYVDSHIGFRIGEPIGGTSDMEFANLVMDFAALCENRRFYNSVAAATNYTWDHIGQNTRIAASLEDLAKMIEHELSL